MRRALPLLLLLATGCPGSGSAGKTGPAGAKTAGADPAATPTPRTAAPSATPAPAAGDDSDAAPVEPTATASPAAGGTPIPEGDAGPPVDVRPGRVLRPQRKLMIGLVEVRRRPEKVAWLSVGIGEQAFRVHLVVGDRLFAGGAVFSVASLDPQRGVQLRRVVAPPPGPARITAAPAARRLRLATMGLYRLDDGRVIGVGNARVPQTVGAEGKAHVPLTVYPKNYDLNPVLEYDLHEAVVAKQRVKGKVATLTLVGVSPDSPVERGSVVLRVVR